MMTVAYPLTSSGLFRQLLELVLPFIYILDQNRIADNEDELKSLRYNQNTYIFPDIRVLENEVIDFKLERERIRKDISRLNEIIHE